MRTSILAGMCAVLPLQNAQAVTLLDVSGPNDITAATQSLGNVPAIGFSIASDYTNVSITVPLMAFGGGGLWNLQAFLTTQIGPGANAADHEIVSSQQQIAVAGSGFAPPYTLTPYTVFSGLNLAAGTYFLTLGGTFETATAFWAGSPLGSLSVNTAAGVNVVAHSMSGTLPAPYLPASFFLNTAEGPNAFGLWLTVTGDPVLSTVPEPAAFLLVALGIAAFVGFRSRSV